MRTEIEKKLSDITKAAEVALAENFAHIERVAYKNTKKIMDAFKEHRVSDSCFNGTSGYGYDDRGREVLDKVWADVFGCEAALVRHNIVNGTHAIATALYGLLRPGDIMLSVSGKPYDTLASVIGNGETPKGIGSLADYGVEYMQTELNEGKLDLNAASEIVKRYSGRVKVIFIQRSKGYLNRRTLTVEEIGNFATEIKKISPESFVCVDNCYGEFTESVEPSAVGADIVVGSLIKNPGGGMAESGGYIAGTEKAVTLASYRLTTPGVGGEVGATLGQNKSMFKGLFYAPHTVAQALKTAHFAAYVFDAIGYKTYPHWSEQRSDIIQTVITGSAEGLCRFCQGIQAGSPVDAYVCPEPWDMPGYSDKIIMAAGTFVQGASIELSADGPIKEPYTAYFQGGLTYESGKIGILSAAEKMLEDQ